ncbi:MAG: ABC transporter permease [Actinomycetaceae bacterium]|nr:ABC transporter permease [Actinomycetaceae bacterium]
MSNFRHVLNLTLTLAKREVTSEYKGTALGRVWSLINPLATIAVFAIIFGVVFRGRVEPGLNSGIDSFALWIGIGVLSWTFLSTGIIKGMNALVANAGLLTKVYFPRYVLVVSAMLALCFNFSFEVIVMVLVMGLVGGPQLLLYVPMLLVVVVLTALFSTGLGLTLSVATVYFRDIRHLWGIFNQVWMYASGVIFPISMLATVQESLFEKGWQLGGGPIPLTTIFRANPAEMYLEGFRSILYDFATPPWEVWASMLGWALASMVIGVLVFTRHSGRIVEEL